MRRRAYVADRRSRIAGSLAAVPEPDRHPAVLPPRDAATVMLVRDAPTLEVFMLRRNLRSEWIAGASIFPGGAIDPADRDPRWSARCDGWDDDTASRALGVARGGLGFWVGAVRETFEEAGVLLARTGDGTPVDGSAANWGAARDALNAGATGFAEFVAAHGLRLATDELEVFSHWVTPPGGPRRYNTWFLVAAAPPGDYRHDDTELIASSWVRPADALAAADRGDIDLILPTRRNLVALTRFRCAADVLDAARRARGDDGAVRFVTESGAGRRIVLPGESVDDGRTPCPT
jgi:8-oxo-dGTP pyrophosphatase MutT (NUDIX family)